MLIAEYMVITDDKYEIPIITGNMLVISKHFGKHPENLFRVVRDNMRFMGKYRIVKVEYDDTDPFDDLVETDECRELFARYAKMSVRTR